MRRALTCAIVALACGPSVDAGEDAAGSTSTDTSASTASTTVDPTNGTSATTASTSATTASTSATTASTSTTTVGTFGDDSTDDTADTGSDFILVPDGGGFCPLALECDLWAQDCPEGEKCMPWTCPGSEVSWGSNICSPLDPNPADIGEPCTASEGPYGGVDDCDISAMCWGVDPDTLVGECVAFCSGSEANPVCEDDATSCFMGWGGGIILCLPHCNPLASACDAGEACIFDSESSEGTFVCMPDVHVAPQAYGDDCSEAVACGTGLVCRPAADVPGCVGTHCCTTLGDSGASPVCPDPMQTCLPLYPDGEAPAGLENLCFCGVGA